MKEVRVSFKSAFNPTFVERFIRTYFQDITTIDLDGKETTHPAPIYIDGEYLCAKLPTLSGVVSLEKELRTLICNLDSVATSIDIITMDIL